MPHGFGPVHGPGPDIEPDDTVEVEVEEGSLLQLPGSIEGTDGVLLMQTTLTWTQHERWHRLLVRLQRELAGQSKATRGYNVVHLRARLLSVVNTASWTECQDQFYALLIAMAEHDSVIADEGDQDWVQNWAEALQEFVPGLEVPVKVVRKRRPVLVESQDSAAGGVEPTTEQVEALQQDEAQEQQLREAEDHAREMEAEYFRKLEEMVWQRQAADYQAWEDWEVQAALARSRGEEPVPRRKGCVVDIEVASGSMEQPRTTRRQVYTVPDEGRLEIKVNAVMVDDVPDSEVSTVVISPPQAEGGSEELGYHDFELFYKQWRVGSLTEQEILTRWGRSVLDMMEAQLAAQLMEDEDVGVDRGVLATAPDGQATPMDGTSAGDADASVVVGATFVQQNDSVQGSGDNVDI